MTDTIDTHLPSGITINRANGTGYFTTITRVAIQKALAYPKIPNKYKNTLMIWLNAQAAVTSTTVPKYAGVSVYDALNAVKTTLNGNHITNLV